MSRPEVKRLVVWPSLFLLGAALAVLVLLAAGAWWFADPHHAANRESLQPFALRAGVTWVLLFAASTAVWLLTQTGIRERVRQHMPAPGTEAAGTQTKGSPLPGEVRDYLRDNYGVFWRRHVRVLLVVGEEDEIKAVAPELAGQNWQEGRGTVLLWGGNLKGKWESHWPDSLRKLSWRRPLDGVVWVLTEAQREHEETFAEGSRRLQALARSLRWQAPLYLWQVSRSQWEQDGQGNPAVGCLLPGGASPEHVERALLRLLPPLRERGIAHLEGQASRDFFLRLSRDLDVTGVSQWRHALAPLLGNMSRGVPLRGLFFSLPLKPSESVGKHNWWPAPAWSAIREDDQAGGRTLGWTWLRGLRTAALATAALCALGVLLSYASNRSQIATVETALSTLAQPGDADAQLSALNELTRELSRLDYQREHGVPWYQRLGLSQNDALLAALWPRYAQANNRLLRDVAAGELEAQLVELAALPPGAPERASRAEAAHAQLKAYLMMARPERADAAFLAKVLSTGHSAPPGVSPGLWQALAPSLRAFYAQHLATHPEWRIDSEATVVARARQVLLGQLGQRNGVANLYQQVLERASNDYADMSLMEMIGETDASMLFDTPNSVPGVFTRQAWEGQVRKAIDEVAEARREEIDWVLSDQRSSLD
ncbi:ImcF-related family protein, partial [Pseudomonas citronellolis]|uniref:ImcF-related family protein n=1 Tax=Pseudomonas citronellolis TaxID=53408 RepID=UPI0023E3F6F4